MVSPSGESEADRPLTIRFSMSAIVAGHAYPPAQVLAEIGRIAIAVPRRSRSHRAADPRPVYLTQETCVTSWSIAARETAALVAKRGVSLAGKVARVASPTMKTLKSFAKFW